jgi:mRNA-degrading endonuclease RelE of RelBE toxin-antitoxin system
VPVGPGSPGRSVGLRRTLGPILALARDQRPLGAALLAGSAFWWLRIGEVRIVYTIDDAPRAIVVLSVVRRGESTFQRVR